jgi:hypothetical protein
VGTLKDFIDVCRVASPMVLVIALACSSASKRHEPGHDMQAGEGPSAGEPSFDEGGMPSRAGEGGGVSAGGGRPSSRGGAAGATAAAGAGGVTGAGAVAGRSVRAGSGGRGGSAGAVALGGSGATTAGTGAGGRGGMGGNSGTAGVAGSDPLAQCRTDPGGPDFDHAGSYELGTTLDTCLNETSDIDYYTFTTPDDPAGGYVAVTVSGIDNYFRNPYTNELVVAMYAGSDSYQVTSFGNAATESQIAFWFGVEPSTRYTLNVGFLQTTFDDIVKYTLATEYHATPDPFEPNQSKGEATRLEVGTPATSYMTAGYTSSSSLDAEWWDFFVVTLDAGPATVTLSNLPTDLRFEFYVYDALTFDSQIWGYAYGLTAGQDITLTTDASMPAGDYYVFVEPLDGFVDEFGAGTTPANNFTHTYTLTVTQ